MAERAGLRLGDTWYSVADGLFNDTGARGLRDKRRSIFPGRQTIQGLPGVQNVRDDDLRWAIDQFSGGEGQLVIDPNDPASFRRYLESEGIDTSFPSQLRLTRAMSQHGLSGGAGTTTVEGDTWADAIGTSTVVGTDRRLEDVGDRITKDISLATGAHQIAFFAYEESPPTRYDGDTLVKIQAPVQFPTGQANLNGEGATVAKQNRNPIVGDVTVRARVQAITSEPNSLRGSAEVSVTVRNSDNGNVIVTKKFDVAARAGFQILELTFRAQSGKTYDYRVQAKTFHSISRVELDYIEEDEEDDRTILWEIRDGGATVASGTRKLNGTTAAGIQVAVASVIEAAGPTTYTLRVTHEGGASRRVYVDKATHRQVTMNDPRSIELGLDDRVWLVDSATGVSPAMFWWDPQNDVWVSAGTAGPAGALGIAMAHSDHYEYVALDDKIVYRATDSVALAAATSATADSIVGITVGGNRLFILTESQANGTELYEHPLEGAAAAPTVKYQPGNIGITKQNQLPRRLAGTASGAVFFANQGPDCVVYQWDGAAGTPMAKLPTGFRGRAIVHGNGVTIVGGGFPAVISDGTTFRRPALFLVPHDGSAPIQLDVQLWRESDVLSSAIMDMQLYGTDLWVVIENLDAAPTVRLWRVSLRSPVAGFLDQTLSTDETQVDGRVRGLAVTFREKWIAVSKGNPYRQSTAYLSTGHLTASDYNFGLIGTLELLSLDLMADIPAGTKVILGYSLDGADFIDVVATVPGRLPVATPVIPALFSRLAIRVQLESGLTTDTPVVYRVLPRAYLVGEADQLREWTLWCATENSAFRTDGGALPGWRAVDNIRALASSGAVIEFEDNYTRPNHSRIGLASIVDLDIEYLAPGEAIGHVTLMERP